MRRKLHAAGHVTELVLTCSMTWEIHGSLVEMGNNFFQHKTISKEVAKVLKITFSVQFID